MLFTSRKKALEFVPSQNNVTILFKNWIPPNFHWQEKGYFQKIGFFLVSMIVSYSGNKGVKSFSV